MNGFRSVIVEVRGGIVHVLQKSQGVRVEVRDYDVLDYEDGRQEEYGTEIYMFNDEIVPNA